MIQNSKQADEQREAGPVECWCLHGAVGMAADWRSFSKRLADSLTSSRAVDLWRFLACQAMPIDDFGDALNAEARGKVFRGTQRALIGYSMGGRLALHALLKPKHPWQAAVIIGAHPGLEDSAERKVRAASDAGWASKALIGDWQTFLDEWDAQPLLKGGTIRNAMASSQLKLRRQEIARSFVDWSLGNQEPIWDRLHQIKIPLLWIVGDRDAKFLELAQRAVSHMPQARLAIAPNAGHRVPWHAEEWLSQEVSRFLQIGSGQAD